MQKKCSAQIQLLRNKRQKILIFGAQLVAEEVAQCLMEAPFCCSIDTFIVSRHSNNPKQLLGVNVIDINELIGKYSTERLIIIATMDKHVRSVVKVLNQQGFYNLLPLSFESDEWCSVQDLYLQDYCKKHEYPYVKYKYSRNIKRGVLNDSVHIYSVKSIYDKELTEQIENSWEIPIQVGASLTEEKICSIQDNTGINISEKNKQYCELTALYWIWKNDKSEYKGLGHYRRHFCFSDEEMKSISQSGADVIVTVPVLNFPDVKRVYCHDHYENDWDLMVEAVHKFAPEYETALYRLENSRYYYAYNMFIAREHIFNHYCEWLFPILFYCEENSVIHESDYQNRYIGFLAERLLTIYLFKHEEEYRIEVADKHFVR